MDKEAKKYAKENNIKFNSKHYLKDENRFKDSKPW